MRKVKFQIWITGVWEKGHNNPANEGTNCYGPVIDGLFHIWGYEAIENRETIVMQSVGIVEDLNGKVWQVQPEKITFIN